MRRFCILSFKQSVGWPFSCDANRQLLPGIVVPVDRGVARIAGALMNALKMESDDWLVFALCARLS